MTFQIVKLQLIYSKDERHLAFRTRDFLLNRSLWLFESFVASQLIGFLACKIFRSCSHYHQADHIKIPLFFALETPIENPLAHHSPQNLPCDSHESFLYSSYPSRTQYWHNFSVVFEHAFQLHFFCNREPLALSVDWAAFGRGGFMRGATSAGACVRTACGAPPSGRLAAVADWENADSVRLGRITLEHCGVIHVRWRKIFCFRTP